MSLSLQLLEKQRGVERMVELLQLYAEQDEAYGDLVEATTELYHYLLQPFRDMRELAMLRRQQIKVRHTHTLYGRGGVASVGMATALSHEPPL